MGSIDLFNIYSFSLLPRILKAWYSDRDKTLVLNDHIILFFKNQFLITNI